MSVVSNPPSTDRVILRNVSWETYERLLKDLEDSSSPRLAFDRGVLEIMSPHSDHEETNLTIASVIEITLDQVNRDFRSVGSTTFKREILERGFEPDSSFYIQSVDNIRSKRRITMETDPPPDLVVEVDLTNDSLDKFSLMPLSAFQKLGDTNSNSRFGCWRKGTTRSARGDWRFLF